MSRVNNQLAQLFWNVQRFELWFVGFMTKVCPFLWTEWVIVTLHLWWVEFWLVFFFEKGLKFLLDQMDYNETSLMISRTLVCFLFDKGSIFFWIRWTTMWFHLWLVEPWLVFFCWQRSNLFFWIGSTTTKLHLWSIEIWFLFWIR